MKTLIALLLLSFSSYGQMDAATFEATVSQHGWHPSERGLLLFSGVHTITSIHPRYGENITDEGYTIELGGINEDDSKFQIEGNCTLR
ncbi:MAG: hypothetical protein ACI865_002024 [Flavobacteriaceae bacterium]|jgi:hypothetical protein